MPNSVAFILEEGRLGGPQVYVAELAKELDPSIKVTVIVPELDSERFRTKLDNYGVQYQIFRLSRLTRNIRDLLQYLVLFLFEVIQIRRYFKKQDFDLIYLNGGCWQYKGIIAAKLSGCRVCWQLNDTSMPWLFRKLFSLLSRYADGFIFASQRSRDYYGGLIRRSQAECVIQSPVDTRYFSNESQIYGEEQLISSWEGKLVIGTVANINPVKGLELFTDVAAILNQRQECFEFVVVGAIFRNQKMYFQELEKRCSDLSLNNITFLGQKDDVRPFLKRFDIYFCCSLFESSPVSVWEAMSMEKPIISTKVGDVPLYVRSGESGLIVDSRNAEKIAKQFTDLVKNREKRKEFARRAREIALRELDVGVCVEKHQQAFRTILKSA